MNPVSWSLPDHVLVTGAAGAIGGAIVRRLCDLGVGVIATDRHAGETASLPPARWITADLTTTEGRQAILHAVDSEPGRRIGGVVHAAGILDPSDWERVEEQDFDRIFAVNVKAPFFLIRALRDRLTPSASVVLIGSIAGERGSPNTALYAASKAALRNLAATLALALAPEGKRVNVLAPGLIDTPLSDALNARLAEAAGRTADEIARERAASVPMGCAGHVDDVADTCLYLLSDGARFVAGATFFATGGALAGGI